MAKVVGYIFLAITAIVGLFSVYQIQQASDTIAGANTQIKQQKVQAAKAEQYLEDTISTIEDDLDPMEGIKFEEERQDIEDEWNETAAE